MEKFKNFIYDKNDIVIALVIIVLATFIITGRINAIMAYPQSMLNQPQGAADTPAVNSPEVPGIKNPVIPPVTVPPAPVVKPPVTVPPANTPPPPATGTLITVTIPSGSTGDAIAKILISSGLIAQKSDFTSAVAAAGAERKLKAGTFKVPTGSTPAQIVAIVTK